jgi:hypothetical protein
MVQTRRTTDARHWRAGNQFDAQPRNQRRDVPTPNVESDLVREIDIYYTCWLYSLCNFQYRQHSENTCSYNFDC